MWAGSRLKGPIRIKISVAVDPFDYTIELGLRPESEVPLFPTDPQIKEEVIKIAGKVLVDRKSSVANMRDLEGNKELKIDLLDTESILSQISEPDRYPALFHFREAVNR